MVDLLKNDVSVEPRDIKKSGKSLNFLVVEALIQPRVRGQFPWILWKFALSRMITVNDSIDFEEKLRRLEGKMTMLPGRGLQEESSERNSFCPSIIHSYNRSELEKFISNVHRYLIPAM